MPESDDVAATRAVYDAGADRYVDVIGTELSAATETFVDRALLRAFVELVDAAGGTRVADVGCGPGRVAASLAKQGLDVVGVDLSLEMVAAARVAHPGIAFAQGLIDQLPFADRSLAGVVGWYSVIHTPPEGLGIAFTEIGRVLSSTGYLLVAFQEGDGQPVHHADGYGTGRALTSYRHSLNDVAAGLEHAGFEVHATARREPELDHETTPQAFVIARRASHTRQIREPPCMLSAWR